MKRIYDDRETNTTINKIGMEELIKLCTKDVYYNFKTRYLQENRVIMGSLLAQVLAFNNMVELERAIIAKLSHLQFYKRYVNHNICFVCN